MQRHWEVRELSFICLCITLQVLCEEKVVSSKHSYIELESTNPGNNNL